jgi:hypothetical protein
VKRAVFALALFAAACNPQPSHGPAGSSPTPSAGPSGGVPPLLITSYGNPRHPLVFYGQKGNRIAYKMIVRDRAIANTAQGAGDGTFYDVTVTFYDRSGKTLEASSPRAVAVEAKQTLTLYDGVRATSSTRDILTCRTLVYDRASGKLHGEGNVRISSADGFWTTGNRLDSDVTLENVVLK